jgi:uncharacterized protein (DUF2147 family)
MKYTFFFCLYFLFALNINAQITGTWYNIDDEDGEPKSHISIYENDGKLEAKVIKLLPNATLKICSSCEGQNKDKPIEGMNILWNLKKVSKTEYEDGTILNPKNGKVYDCFISLEEQDKLKVRGYLGVSLFGKTQYWYRVK